MKKLAVLMILLSGLALAQSWEYAVYGVDVISGSTRSVIDHYFSSGTVSLEPQSAQGLVTALGGAYTNALDIVQVLNVLGADGWEVVGIQETGDGVVYLLKRPR